MAYCASLYPSAALKAKLDSEVPIADHLQMWRLIDSYANDAICPSVVAANRRRRRWRETDVPAEIGCRLERFSSAVQRTPHLVRPLHWPLVANCAAISPHLEAIARTRRRRRRCRRRLDLVVVIIVGQR